jgi:2-amino-4-hydroxy-6-hydroxymethyldihydropteridine diphosphokinase/dihydropteroate synthase
LEPIALLDTLQEIEKCMGRKKLVDKGPRNIDLDILLYEDQVVDHERLKIPHPSISEREFVLRPLVE